MHGKDELNDGRSCVGSYHLKTTFLHYLEKNQPSTITSPFGLMINLLRDMDGYLKDGKLPHYFLPQCNLLSTVGSEESHIARQTIRYILSDPINAILTSPTTPLEIYGFVRTASLVTAFRHMQTDSTCLQKLVKLLNMLDNWRQFCYHKKLDNEQKKYPGEAVRPPPARLVSMVKEATHM